MTFSHYAEAPQRDDGPHALECRDALTNELMEARLSDESSFETSFAAALAQVETSGNSPIVLSPYGFKVEQIDGKKYLVAGTAEEAAEALAARPGETRSKEVIFQALIHPGRKSCLLKSDGWCAPKNGCGECYKVHTGSVWICRCGDA